MIVVCSSDAFVLRKGLTTKVTKEEPTIQLQCVVIAVAVTSTKINPERIPKRPRETHRTQTGPERPGEAQKSPEELRNAQRGPDRPREAQRGQERGPERPREAQ